MIKHVNKSITEADLVAANPWFFWEPMVKCFGEHKGTLKIMNNTMYYFVRYESHTTVYDVNPTTLELTYRAEIGVVDALGDIR